MKRYFEISMLFTTILLGCAFLSSCSSEAKKVEIQMQEIGGVYQIPCKVNGVSMNFIFDTGASNVCISLTEALYLYKNGYITNSDFGSTSYSQVADGNIVENMQLNLRSVEVEGIVINDVEAIVVSSLNAPLLLGQTAIQRLGSIEMNGNHLSIYPDYRNSSRNGNKKDVGLIEQIQDWWNDGWHYEYDYEVYTDRTFKLYSKVINGKIEYKIKDTYLNYDYPVEENKHFGDEKFDSKHYKYKYVWGPPWEYFNIKGDDVERELAMIKAKRWVFVREVYLFYVEKSMDGQHQCLEKEEANLYWRESDGEFKVVPCGKYNGREFSHSYYDYELGKYKYNEPNNPREIMVEEGLNYKYYEKHIVFDEYMNYVNRWVDTYDAFTHKAAEYSFDL